MGCGTLCSLVHFAGVESVLSELRETAMGDRADDAWEKAAACERHAQATSDSNLKAMFLRLRQSWIRAGNDAQFDCDLNANEERVGHTE